MKIINRLLVATITTLALVSCSPAPEETPKQSTKEKVTALSKETVQDLKLHVPSPDWRDQVIYFMMTDRFYDGDPTNNDQGTGEYDPKSSAKYSGGDLQGIIDKLDYLQNMGMTAVWSTPWVANQWWSQGMNYGGYHGYWATNFSEVDAHLGTKDTLRQLSDQLHRRNMYLIQDIVVNHTANFFNYHGGQDGYDAKDTARNFYLLEDETSPQPAPTQKPFDLIDRNNPDHVAADIYHWTPSITDYKNEDHQWTYQLATLADINTKNPVVRDKFKEIYGNWIREVGVDAFRIDTVRYVDNEFFHHFMHDADGIHARAKETGRENFLAFGEVFDTSRPFENDAEKRIAAYLGTAEKPELNSQISFALHQELKTVFAQGFPTAQLAYRLQQHMEIYPNPYVFPTFIDNHDMGRFLTSGDKKALKQALATIFTIPGIPTIYQGTEQGMTQSRQAMFKGGYNADKDYFNQKSGLYKYIQALAKMRTSDKLFTRGDMTILASDNNGPGILAYKRTYEGREALILMNTSTRKTLVSRVKVSDKPAELKALFGTKKNKILNGNGELTTELPARATYVFEVNPIQNVAPDMPGPEITSRIIQSLITQDLPIEGTVADPKSALYIVKNNQLESAIKVKPDEKGNWQYTYPVTYLGEETVTLVAYQPRLGLASAPLGFTTLVNEAAHSFSFTDPVNDDTGLSGNILPPQHVQSVGQQDITNLEVEIGGEVMILSLTMREVTDDWIPPNGFDNVSFSVFFDAPLHKENRMAPAKVLPMINTKMPEGNGWDFAHVVYGWGNTTFSNEGASSKHQGKRFGVAPQIMVDKNNKTISMVYLATDFGVKSWLGSKLYITTWDITGEGEYRKLTKDKSDWSFSGGEAKGPKVLDSMFVTLGDRP